MSVSISYELTLYVCKWCGCGFAVPCNYNQTIHCPNGHSISGIRGDSIIEQMHNERQRAVDLSNEIQRLNRTISSLRGALHRRRK